jgi:hypothetical protein
MLVRLLQSAQKKDFSKPKLTFESLDFSVAARDVCIEKKKPFNAVVVASVGPLTSVIVSVSENVELWKPMVQHKANTSVKNNPVI